MAFALIRSSDNFWLEGPREVAPEPAEGEHVVIVALGYPGTCEWSPSRGAFVDLAAAGELITIGRFKLLFTQAERIALRAAAKQDPAIEDIMDLLDGFTAGISLSDPVLVDSLAALVTAGLIDAARAPEIIAGEPPT